MLNDLDRIMVNQLVIMNALRLATNDEAVKKDLVVCINQTIGHNSRIEPGIGKVCGVASLKAEPKFRAVR